MSPSWILAVFAGLLASQALVSAQTLGERECRDDPYDLHAIEGNCNQFIQCAPFGPVIRDCPQTLVFNENLTICDWIRNVPRCQALGPCLVNQCRNGGLCVPNNRFFTCDCRGTGFSGNFCENFGELQNPCDINQCQNGGMCVPFIDGFSFTCNCSSTGFSGNLCQIPDMGTNPCVNNPCQNGGVCQANNGFFTCDCANTFFHGDRCQFDVCQMQSSFPCMNGGMCIPSMADKNQFSCQCTPGFEGDDCSLPSASGPNPCNPDPCENGGVCSLNGTTFACDCSRTRFYGDRCQEDVCQTQTSNPCQNGGACIAHPTDKTLFGCLCSLQFQGNECSLPAQFSSCQPNPCYNGGVCSSNGTSVSCDCSQTFFFGDRCQASACQAQAVPPCQNGGICVPGFTFRGEFSCQCPPGFDGNDCSQQTTPAQNPCDPNPCQNGGTCSANGNTFTCNCNQTLFYGDRCESNFCQAQSTNPCQNGGTCMPSLTFRDQYSCQCTTDFQGLDCSLPAPTGDPCALVPCHHGTCHNSSLDARGFACHCIQGFQGHTCEALIPDACVPNPCVMGACEYTGFATSPFRCSCFEGFEGDFCNAPRNATTPDICDPNPCRNGGQCIASESGDSATCDCTNTQFTGATCDVRLTFCSQNPCLNGGQCLTTFTGFSCNCGSTGFSGFRCQSRITEPGLVPFPGGGPSCPLYSCPSNVRNYNFPSWTSCSRFYNCAFGTLQERVCGQGQQFDVLSRLCQPMTLQTAIFCSSFL